ncbi:glycosyltransferase [Meiothermus sp.]|uniref:glycosyltransferase n=1 Tax=Meiothermus sp. TaxID=1955249 RepID=UPI0039A1DC5C
MDSTVELAREFGFTVCQVNHAQFDHGGTRQLGAELLPNVDLLIYMTQDAVLAASDAIELLVSAFADPKVGVAYGRQLPNLEANPIEAHARLFNYREHSEIRTMQDARSKGLRTAFNSNSFACYRRPALEQVGGFPKKDHFRRRYFCGSKDAPFGMENCLCSRGQSLPLT